MRSEVGEFSTGQISTKDVVGSLHKQALTGEGGQHYPLQKFTKILEMTSEQKSFCMEAQQVQGLNRPQKPSFTIS